METRRDMVMTSVRASWASPYLGAAPHVSRGELSFVREGDGWRIAYAGRTVWLAHRVGMGYLAELLARPHQPIKVTELVAARAALLNPDGLRACGPDLAHAGDAGELLDDRALRTYRARVAELHLDLERAKYEHDLGRTEQLQHELEFLLRELSRAVGLSGRVRRAGSASERARVSVTRAIRKAIERIARAHPELAEHLRASIRTGSACSYAPSRAEQIEWAT